MSMSVLGHFGPQRAQTVSALHRLADIVGLIGYVRKVPLGKQPEKHEVNSLSSRFRHVYWVEATKPRFRKGRLPLRSKAEVSPPARHVRSTLNSRHRQAAPACPKSATSGLLHCSKLTRCGQIHRAALHLRSGRERIQGAPLQEVFGSRRDA
jgi:hypothetical protein